MFEINGCIFEKYCDNYDFISQLKIENNEEFYFGFDIPCVNDPVWRFWKLYENENIKWNLSYVKKEKIKKQIIEYLIRNGYVYNNTYFTKQNCEK